MLESLATKQREKLQHVSETFKGLVNEPEKKLRYVRSFFARKLIHTNLQILYNCNFRCQICDFWKKPARMKPKLSLDQVDMISDKLAQIGPQIVSIGGGEPLLHKDLDGIVRTLARHHFPVMICNGWFMTEEKAAQLFEAGIHEISVSVDYIDPAKHDAQRGVEGAWQHAIDALQSIERARTKSWQRVHMISVIMSDNIDHVEPLIQKCGDMGITYLVTLYSDARGRPEDRKAKNSRVSEELLRLKDKYPEFVQLRGYLSRFSEAVDHGGVGPCYAGKNLCNIDSQGNVSLCIDHLEDSVGNILEEDMQEIERKLVEKHLNNTCKTCWTSCRGAIETLMHGDSVLSNLIDYYGMTKPMPLGR
ncbi:MAG: hypothetical protein AUK47_14960 [Deltaproteobacteria bacterium CG2_30_63_29]|nr:MAG: hypothetical protein AUK47_14960 [Deltaproteobacteria bacterium CG2_30_63_29]PJB43061.1 MAG: hypothetical protein CO108_10635 [Deltaproteobacteria bacterium CG_4_9_14_3_um_filter_63_12]